MNEIVRESERIRGHGPINPNLCSGRMTAKSVERELEESEYGLDTTVMKNKVQTQRDELGSDRKADMPNRDYIAKEKSCVIEYGMTEFTWRLTRKKPIICNG
jgi:hypothetical protein